jgi:hypoxanthine phosphoribosyltransferase
VNKIYYNWAQVEGACLDIIRQMNRDQWQPDYIVGITRGGLIPANLISQYLDVPMETLKVSLRDSSSESESNLWMAEDAYGFNAGKDGDPCCKNILIVDDINDQGSTIAWIKQDWQSSCLPNDARWNHVWGENVRVAVLTNNLASKQDVDYSVWEVNKAEEDCWLVYPWEDYWL